MKFRNGNKVKSIMVINTEGVHNLRMAIIQSDWFMLLSNGDINGEYILNKLNKYSN